MDYTARMRIGQRIGHFAHNPPDVRKGQCALHPHAVAEVLAFDEGHDEISEPVFFVDGIDLYDVRMIQSRRCLGLAHESFSRVGPESEVGRQQLDRHFTLEARISRPVDDSGAAASNLPLDLIGRSERPIDASSKL
jgi:hypothetical protein